MKTHPTLAQSFAAFLFAISAGTFALPAYAQRTIPSPEDTPIANTSKTDTAKPASDEVVEMSPFVVSESSDVGYTSTSSLAGTRLKTELKDIASQIDVMTAEFISDIAATNMGEAVAFSTNSADQFEQAASPAEADGPSETGVRSEVRARGFDDSNRSSDFFNTNLPSDFYNSDRLTIANGPQSILFGLGTAGGVLDYTTKRAVMKNSAAVEFRIDSWGSNRASFDVNQQLVRGKLAVRVDGLYSDAESFIKGGYNKQKRLFGTLTWRPFKNTTVRVLGEAVQQYRAGATNYISRDFLSPWVAAGRPLYDNSKGNASIGANDPQFSKNTNAVQVLSYGANAIGDGVSQANWNGSALTKGPHQLVGAADPRQGALLDNSIFPIDTDPRVFARKADLTGKLVRAFLEQKITDDFYFELSASYEEMRELTANLFDLPDAIAIRADPNKYLSGGTATNPVYAPNPNAGRMFIESFPHGWDRYYQTGELRFTASYEFDFAKKFQGPAAWFGKHRLAALGSYREDETRFQENRALIVGNPAFATGDKLNSSRYIRTRYYFDPAAGNVSATPLRNGGIFGPYTGAYPTTGENYTAYLFDNPEGRGYLPTGTRSEITTMMFALQSFFIKDRLNVFFGWRSDHTTTCQMDANSRKRGDFLSPGDQKGLYMPMDQARFDSDNRLSDTGNTKTLGAVAHPLNWLSFFYSKSENHALPTGYLDPYNKALPGTYSDGYDFGVRLDLLQNKLGVRLNFYRENQNSYLAGVAQAIRTQATNVEMRLRGPERPVGIADIPVDGFDPVGRGSDSYRAAADKTSKGMDLTIVGRPLPGWDIRVAVGKQHTYLASRAKAFSDWVRRRLPVWEDAGGLGWDNVTMSDTDPQTIHEYYTNIVGPQQAALKMVEGEDRFRQRRWRASLFTNYRFQGGTLKGFFVGGGARWLDRAMIGKGRTQVPGSDMLVEDPKKPYFGEPLFFMDLNAGYSFMRRLGSVPCKITLQVNVRNLLDADDLDVVQAAYDGSALEVARPTPRQVIVTLRLEF